VLTFRVLRLTSTSHGQIERH